MNEDQELKGIIQKITKQAQDTLSGVQRAKDVESVITRFLPNWSKALGFSELEILKSIEKNRRVNAVNHYQENSFPMLDDIKVFETLDCFHAMHKKLGFRCPSCNQISTNPQECNHNTETCNWKSYGLFKCLGKEYQFAVKETFLEDGTIYEIFQPIALENDSLLQKSEVN